MEDIVRQLVDQAITRRGQHQDSGISEREITATSNDPQNASLLAYQQVNETVKSLIAEMFRLRKQFEEERVAVLDREQRPVIKISRLEKELAISRSMVSEGQTQNDKILQAINMISQNKPEPQASNKEGPQKRSTGHRAKKNRITKHEMKRWSIQN